MAAAAAVILALGALTAARYSRFSSSSPITNTSGPVIHATNPEGGETRTDAVHASGRPVYRYSVVPGGTYTPEELGRAMRQDPVVAAHYRGVEPERLRVETVTADRFVHVSYRQDGRIYWTSNKIPLRRGDTILTDGVTSIRTRCGNRISEQPLSPVSPAEPDEIEFDRLIDDGPSSTAREAADMPGIVTLPGVVTRPGEQQLIATADVGPGAFTPLFDDPYLRSVPFASVPAANNPGGSPGPPSGFPGAGTPSVPLDPLPLPGPIPVPVPPTWADPPVHTDPHPFPPGLVDPLLPPGSQPFPGTSDLFPPPGTYPFGPEPPNGFADPDGPAPGVPLPPVNPVPVPEPATILLVGGGAVALLRRLRSQRR